MQASGSLQGAGRLRGSKFLIFMDWSSLGAHPEWKWYERLMKAWDLFIKTAVLFRNDKDLNEKYGKDLDVLKDRLNQLSQEVMNFEMIEGATSISNDFLGKVNDLLLDLYDLQYKEQVIESVETEAYEVPG
jgi:hypothetical protein